MNTRLRGPLVGIIAAALLAGGFSQSATAQGPVAWAQVRSDLPADPAVVFGQLPNGMRYAIMKSATPPKQVSMRLLIKAGSMHEAKGQEGLAHMVEHMAFNGSKYVPEGEMFKQLERLGLADGADTNAGTGANQTSYRFDLPRNDAQSVETALMLFRQIASELTLSQAAMDRERGVVLSEERTRDGPGNRASEKLQKMLFADHPMARPPIGLVEVLKTAPVSRVKAFYDAYYRPERATLIIAGDIDPATVEARIKERFTDWRGRGPAGKDPAPMKSRAVGDDVETYTDPSLSPQVIVAWMAPPKDKPDSKAAMRERLVESLAMAAFNTRLADMTRLPSPPFMVAIAAPNDVRGVARGAILQTALATDLKASMNGLIEAQRQTMQFGLRQDEIDRVIVQSRTQLQAAVRGVGTRQTPGLANGLLNAAFTDRVFRSPQQNLEAFEATVGTIKLDEINAAFRDRFTGAGPLLFATDKKPIEGGEAALTTAFAAARAAPVTALAKAETKPWPYSDFGAAGAVVDRREVADLGLTYVRFANNVRLTVKPTKFTADQIQVRVMFGAGDLDMPRDKMIAASMWSSVFASGGLAKLTTQERTLTLNGKVAGIGASTGEGGFILSGNTRPVDFDLQMQLLAAYAREPAWRADGFDLQRDFIATALEAPYASAGDAYGRLAPPLLHSGDARWAEPTPAFVRGIKIEDARAFITPILAKADMEVVIVGDITVDAAIAATAKTFGNLPARDKRVEPAGARDVKFPAGSPTPIVVRHQGRADQALATVVWPTNDYFSDTTASAPAKIAQIILTDRLQEEFREKLGKTYGVQGDTAFTRLYPGYGTLTVQSEMPPEAVPGFFEAVDRIAADMQKNGVTRDEFDRAIKPRREYWTRTIQTNAYWSTGLLGAQLEPKREEQLRNVTAELDKMTPADVQKAAQKWLVRDKSWRMSVLPEPKIASK